MLCKRMCAAAILRHISTRHYSSLGSMTAGFVIDASARWHTHVPPPPLYSLHCSSTAEPHTECVCVILQSLWCLPLSNSSCLSPTHHLLLNARNMLIFSWECHKRHGNVAVCVWVRANICPAHTRTVLNFETKSLKWRQQSDFNTHHVYNITKGHNCVLNVFPS